MTRRQGAWLALALSVAGAGVARAQEAEPEAAARPEADAAAEPAAENDDEDEPLVLPILGETTFSLTSTSNAAYRFDNFNMNPYDDDFLVLSQRLESSLDGEELRLSLRLDGSVPLLTSSCPSGEESLCFLEADVRPERFAATWQHDDLTVEAGDFYVVFGRGIALSFRKDDVLGVDTALRGGRAEIDAHRFTMQIVGGISNPQNLDPLTLQVIDEPHDVVLGSEVGMRVGADDDLELAVHALRIWFEQDAESGDDIAADVFGWRVSTPSLFDGALTVYGEANALRRTLESPLLGTIVTYGRAVYGSVQVQTGNTTVLAEWKDYRDYLVATASNDGDTWRIYGAGPALEREDQRVRDTHNARGGHVQVDYAFEPSTWSATASALVYGHNELEEDPWDGVLTMHGWAGLHRRLAGEGEASEDDAAATAPATEEEDAPASTDWSMDVVAGYRREIYLHDPFAPEVGEGDLDWQVIHGEVDFGLSIGEHSFELRVDHRFERRRQFNYVDYVRGGVTLTWSFGPLHISPVLRWDTERKDLNGWYPAGEIKWEITTESHLRFFGGRTPGGQLCSGGVCRLVPPFEGVLLELVLRI